MEDFNLEMMCLKHDIKMYPPRVKMTVVPKGHDCVILPVKITGCSREGRLDMDLTIGNVISYSWQFIYCHLVHAASGSITTLLENRSKDINTQGKSLCDM